MELPNGPDFIARLPFRLEECPTELATETGKSVLREAIASRGKELSGIQDVMYAHDRYSVLIILQGMDTAGKDSLVREVFSQFNPRGVVVHSFKAPSTKELEHDYLWRHIVALPEKGKFAVFNRSHYENVLVTRVNPELLLKERMPGLESLDDLSKNFWEMRYKQIRKFEDQLVQNGTIVFKFFLHLSKEEQRKRLLRRLETPKHQWKFHPGDISERKHWDNYQKYYEEAIGATHTADAPWYIIPADDKSMARFLVADVLLKAMEKYTDIKEPSLSKDIHDNLENYIEMLSRKEI